MTKAGVMRDVFLVLAALNAVTLINGLVEGVRWPFTVLSVFATGFCLWAASRAHAAPKP